MLGYALGFHFLGIRSVLVYLQLAYTVACLYDLIVNNGLGPKVLCSGLRPIITYRMLDNQEVCLCY